MKTWEYTVTEMGIDRRGRTRSKMGSIKAHSEQDAAERLHGKHPYCTLKIVEQPTEKKGE